MKVTIAAPPPTHTHTPTPQFHMGNCAEDTAKKYEVTREAQDEYARRSYTHSARATESGLMAKEIIPVTIPGKKGKPDIVVKIDEEFSKYVKYIVSPFVLAVL